MPKHQTTTTTTTTTTPTTTRAPAANVTTAHSEQSLGPNLKSRLEALEAAMGVRLNVAKRQGRQSLSNTTSSSPMQISPTSTASTTLSTTLSTSLSTSSRHNIPIRSGQGVQRSASSCDVENRPGPIKRLKPSFSVETSSSSTAAAIATIKKHSIPVRRPIPTTIITPVRPTQSKPATLIKQRSSPMDTSSIRSSRSSTTSNTSSSYRTPIGVSPKTSNTPSPKQPRVKSLTSPPPPPRPSTLPRKQRLSIFGEQFSDDILKTNLLWITSTELDDEARTEVLIQFGSMENFLHEQKLFSAKQQQQLNLAAKNKTVVNRSRLQLLIPKKDRLELL